MYGLFPFLMKGGTLIGVGFFFYYSYRHGLSLFYALLGLFWPFFFFAVNEMQGMGYFSVERVLINILGGLFGLGLGYLLISKKAKEKSLAQQIMQNSHINPQTTATQLQEKPLPQTNRRREILISVLYQLFGKGLYIHEVKHQVFFKRKLLYIFCFGYSWLSFINIFTGSWGDARWFHNKTAVGAGSIFAAWIIVYVIGMIDVVSMSYRYRETLSFNKKT